MQWPAKTTLTYRLPSTPTAFFILLLAGLATPVHAATSAAEPREATMLLAMMDDMDKMGGAAATDDLEMGYLTQTWLAVSNGAAATVSGGYWYHRQRQAPAPQARDLAFQDQLMDRLAALTGVALF